MNPAPAPPARANRRGRAGLAVGLLLGVEVVAFSVSTLPGVRARPGFDPVLDGWLQGGAYVTAAVLGLLLVPRRRFFTYGCFGAALTARAAGFVLYLAVVRRLEPVPSPSMADACWLAMYVLLATGFVLMARRGLVGLPASLLLDGLVASLAMAAVAVSLLHPLPADLAEAGLGTAAQLTNLAYPVLDFLLLMVVVGVFMAHRWRPPGTVWALGAGVAGFAVIDSVFVYQLAQGTFRPGSPLAALSLVATGVVAVACAPRLQGPAAPPREEQPGLALPFLFALTSLALLVYATAQPVPWAAVVLASAGVAVAIARTALTFRSVRSVAEHRREARTDELTGVANRRAFNEALARALRGRAPERGLALLMIDLDDFKSVNDSLGHHHGDELLTLVAQRFQHALRSGDLLARTGGDEFAVLVEGADATLGGQVAERLRSGLDRPVLLAGRALDVAASIGISVFPRDGRESAELLQHADIAMYDAKSARSGQSLFHPDQHARAAVARESMSRLSRAVAEELVVHYQPQVSLVTGAVVGVEALVRWQPREDGRPLVNPGAFLHQVERAGLIRRLTTVVLEQSVRQGAAWHRSGSPITVSVNLSVTDLLDGRFPSQVADLLDESGFPGRALELELTEDLFMADPSRALCAIRELLQLDVALVVDDYGTGYSSLGYLRDLEEIRGLKLDRSFVSGLDEDPRARAIVESTISLAHALGLSVVAEGVETEAVRDRLGELGCELAQGYLFSRPVPAAELRLEAVEAARARTR